MSNRLLAIVFVVLMAAVAAFIVATSDSLPERVASHFDGAGAPNGYMTREGYRTFMLIFGIALPLLVAAVIGWLPRLAPSAVNIPNRTYWLAPERREETVNILAAYALRLGILMVVFLAGIHWLVLRANAAQPSRLESAPLLMLLAIFVVTLLWWIASLWRRFRVIG